MLRTVGLYFLMCNFLCTCLYITGKNVNKNYDIRIFDAAYKKLREYSAKKIYEILSHLWNKLIFNIRI